VVAEHTYINKWYSVPKTYIVVCLTVASGFKIDRKYVICSKKIHTVS
jgi:hypothetical protein